MLTSKQRSYLKRLANTIEPTVHVGKGGISDALINQIQESLEVRELIKITLLNNTLININEFCDEISKAINCEIVQIIGKKVVIYKESKNDKKIILPKIT